MERLEDSIKCRYCNKLNDCGSSHPDSCCSRFTLTIYDLTHYVVSKENGERERRKDGSLIIDLTDLPEYRSQLEEREKNERVRDAQWLMSALFFPPLLILLVISIIGFCISWFGR